MIKARFLCGMEPGKDAGKNGNNPRGLKMHFRIQVGGYHADDMAR